MYICFVEYKIEPWHRESFLIFTADIKKQFPEVLIYEGADQPNLFVEVWNCQTKSAAEQIKEERLSGRSPWAVLTDWIVGGRAKLHVWTFQAI